jgi:hypothetical protein
MESSTGRTMWNSYFSEWGLLFVSCTFMSKIRVFAVGKCRTAGYVFGQDVVADVGNGSIDTSRFDICIYGYMEGY